MIDHDEVDLTVEFSGDTAEAVMAEIEAYKKEFPFEIYGTVISQPEQFDGSPLF